MSGLVAVAFLAASPVAADTIKKMPGIHALHSQGMPMGLGHKNHASTTMPVRPFPKNASSTEYIRANFTLGNVTAVNGSSFTIEDRGHKGMATTTYTVMTDSATTFKKAGQSATLSDVTVGQFVMVAGAKNSSNNAITADGVNVVTKKMPEGAMRRGHLRAI